MLPLSFKPHHEKEHHIFTDSDFHQAEYSLIYDGETGPWYQTSLFSKKRVDCSNCKTAFRIALVLKKYLNKFRQAVSDSTEKSEVKRGTEEHKEIMGCPNCGKRLVIWVDIQHYTKNHGLASCRLGYDYFDVELSNASSTPSEAS